MRITALEEIKYNCNEIIRSQKTRSSTKNIIHRRKELETKRWNTQELVMIKITLIKEKNKYKRSKCTGNKRKQLQTGTKTTR